VVLAQMVNLRKKAQEVLAVTEIVIAIQAAQVLGGHLLMHDHQPHPRNSHHFPP
jgi:hypothetical protein